MAPSGRLELRDRMYPSSALQDCAWLLCRVNPSQPLVLSGAPSHCLSSDLSAVPVFIFHSFEKHLLSTFHAPSNWLGAESTPGILLHTLPPPLCKRIHTQSPGPGLIYPSPASQSSMWSPPPSPENAYSGLSSNEPALLILVSYVTTIMGLPWSGSAITVNSNSIKQTTITLLGLNLWIYCVAGFEVS